MSVNKFIYPLDLRGANIANRLIETHVIGMGDKRPLALNHGPFFTENISLLDVTNNTPLERGTHFECVYIYSDLIKRTAGKEVCGVILIIDPTVGTDIKVTANFVGGPYTANTEAIQAAIDAVEADNRNVFFSDVLEKPGTWVPAPHIHDFGDAYGFEYITSILNGIREAALIGDSAKVVALNNTIQSQISDMIATMEAFHNRTDNPHAVTPAQLNVYTKTEVDTLLQAITAGLNANANAINSIGNDISNINNDIGTINSQVTALADTDTTLQSGIDSANQSIVDMGADINNNSSSISTVEDRVTVVEQALS